MLTLSATPLALQLPAEDGAAIVHDWLRTRSSVRAKLASIVGNGIPLAIAAEPATAAAGAAVSPRCAHIHRRLSWLALPVQHAVSSRMHPTTIQLFFDVLA